MNKDEALRLALEALENSDDLVRENAYSAEQLYGNYPVRQGKVRGLKALVEDHEKAITAIKAALEAKDDGITLTTIRHPKGKPALGDLNPESLEQVEIDFPEPVAWQWLGSAHFRKKIPKNADITAWNPLYANPSQSMECNRCKQLEDQVYDLLGDLKVANLKLSVRSQRTWVGLTEAECGVLWKVGMTPFDYYQAIEAKLKEKNT
jgi:hypothetical protein